MYYNTRIQSRVKLNYIESLNKLDSNCLHIQFVYTSTYTHSITKYNIIVESTTEINLTFKNENNVQVYTIDIIYSNAKIRKILVV